MHKKLYLPVILLVLITIGLEILNIHLSSKLASDSVEVKKLQLSIDKFNEENQILNSEVLSQTSFDTIASKAGELGFGQTRSYISLRQEKLSYSR